MTSLTDPWLLARDFNAIISINEPKGGSFCNYVSKANFFSDFILTNHLSDLGFVGSYYTWCNGQVGLAR